MSLLSLKVPRQEVKKLPPKKDPQNMPVNDWKDTFRKYLNKRLEPQKPAKPFVAPRLKITSNFSGIRDVAIGESKTVTMTVINKGNGTSFASYVAVYDGPCGFRKEVHHLSEYKLCDYRIMTIIPGQTVEVKLTWRRSLPTGQLVGVCFDPFYDQRDFDYVEDINDDHKTRKCYVTFK